MASWLTHLRIAEGIKEQIKGFDLSYLLMGSIAPDCAPGELSPEDRKLSQNRTHYRHVREDGTIDFDLKKFYNKYLVPEKIIFRSDKTRSFLWGYYYHLLVDILWHDKYFKPLSEKYSGESNNDSIDKSFVDFLDEEMDSLELDYLLQSNYELIEKLRKTRLSLSCFDELEADCIQRERNRIVDFYYTLKPTGFERQYRFLNEQAMDGFINNCVKMCVSTLYL